MQNVRFQCRHAIFRLRICRPAYDRQLAHGYLTFAQAHPSRCRPWHVRDQRHSIDSMDGSESMHLDTIRHLAYFSRLPGWLRHASTASRAAAEPESPCSTTSRISPSRHPDNRVFFVEDIDALAVLDHRKTHTLYCTKSPSETNSIIKEMIKEGQVFGLDLEWRPTFVKGSKENKTGLIQLCNSKSVLLIQISRMAVFPYELKDMLQSRKILKAGVNIRGDALKLYRDFRILTNGLVDLGALARTTNANELTGYAGLSLKLLCGIFLGKSLPKGPARLSRWDAATLSGTQRQYAADDAYASFALYQAIEERRQGNSKTKINISHLADDEHKAKPSTTLIESRKSITVTKVNATTVQITKDETNPGTETYAQDYVHTNAITTSTMVEQTSTSMPFTTIQVLKKREP